MDTQLGEIFHTTVGETPRFGAVILTLGAFWLTGAEMARLTLRLGSKGTEHLHRASVRVMCHSLLVIAAISVLETLGANVVAMLAGAGKSGFALKDVLIPNSVIHAEKGPLRTSPV